MAPYVQSMLLARYLRGDLDEYPPFFWKQVESEMLVLITYDVNTQTEAGRKRLRKVAKECVNYGQRVQNSVFECQMDATKCRQVKAILENLIDKEVDSLRFYYLGEKYKNKVEHIGARPGFDVTDTLIFQCKVGLFARLRYKTCNILQTTKRIEIGRSVFMFYPFMTLNDNTEIVHSEVIEKNGCEKVEVRIEKPVYGGFHSASCWLPDYRWENIDGFSEEEIKYFQEYLKSVAHIIM